MRSTNTRIHLYDILDVFLYFSFKRKQPVASILWKFPTSGREAQAGQ